MFRKSLKLGVIVSLFLGLTSAHADFSDDEVRVAVITDLTAIYSNVAGQGAAIAAQMAVEDFGGSVNGTPIKLIVVDHKSDGEIAMELGRKLHEEDNVDAFVEMVSSGTAVPLQKYAREKGIVTLHSGAASSLLTGKECSKTGVHWAYDTNSLPAGVAQAIVRDGGKTWYFVAADYIFGQVMVRDTTKAVEALGGEVLGTSYHKHKGTDFTKELLEAQDSKAQVIALGNAGGDALLSIRQAYELGMLHSDQQRIAAMLIFLPDIRTLGLYVSAGLQYTTGFYWNYDARTREWSDRFLKRTGTRPTMIQASVYSSMMHYFKAMAEADTDEGVAVVDTMKQLPVDDFFSRNAYLRDDGRMVHDMYLVRVKKASESKEAWDYLEVIGVVPGENAFRPLEESDCPYLPHNQS